jgi:CBS domain-containing protein
MNVSQILRGKGAEVVTIGGEAGVAELARVITERNVGAAVVVEDGRMVGIVSERDVVRGMAAHGAGLSSMQVAELMTRQVVSCRPEDEVAPLMATMTARRIRHLPVLIDGRLVGIVSIGDLVKARLDEVDFEAAALREYISAAR